MRRTSTGREAADPALWGSDNGILAAVLTLQNGLGDPRRGMGSFAFTLRARDLSAGASEPSLPTGPENPISMPLRRPLPARRCR